LSRLVYILPLSLSHIDGRVRTSPWSFAQHSLCICGILIVGYTCWLLYRKMRFPCGVDFMEFDCWNLQTFIIIIIIIFVIMIFVTTKNKITTNMFFFPSFVTFYHIDLSKFLISLVIKAHFGTLLFPLILLSSLPVDKTVVCVFGSVVMIWFSLRKRRKDTLKRKSNYR